MAALGHPLASGVPPDPRPNEIGVVQGEYRVSADASVVLTTLLGSCVAACLYDPKARVGGMNHFLLATGRVHAAAAHDYGRHAMDRLIDSLKDAGAEIRRLEAKLFGAATIEARMAEIGQQNARFALDYLAQLGIPVVASSLGGRHGRRIAFVPTTGQVRQRLLDSRETVRADRPLAPSPYIPRTDT